MNRGNIHLKLNFQVNLKCVRLFSYRRLNLRKNVFETYKL